MNFTKLTEYLDSLETNYKIPGGDCIICQNHETIYRHGFGFSDYEKKKPVDPNDIYMLYSASKVITMTAVLQLIEQGKLHLYDQLTDFFPEFSVLRVADDFSISFPTKWPDKDTPCHLAHRSIRIIDLMTMTSGLSYDTESEVLNRLKERSGNQASTCQVISSMAGMPLVYEPGERWSYNLGHDILAGVVEKVSGMRFSQYLDRNLFGPLGITDFRFRPDAVPSALYRTEIGPDGLLTDNILPYPEGYHSRFRITENYESGGAGLFGTAASYSKFIDCLACGGTGWNGSAFLSGDTVRLFTIPYTTGRQLEDFRMTGKKEYGYGLGVRVRTESRDSLVPPGEFGWDGAAGAYVLADPLNKISIFYVQHVFGFPKAYSHIHPAIRDLAYGGIFGKTE